ncbi:chaperonin CPN60-2 [Artemisia annua]|uniref:Chaperonin CPN60-2 n=1 Tax=Artemisia annua TaxID=35608 RepID=A0A2U1LGY4_ARTAN|nr:chaperonin CPN60-2 [Artemisia annua]
MADQTVSSILEPWHDLSGKVVMVTGASSGIGRDLCIDLAKAGCKIIAAARRVDRLKSLCDEINGQDQTSNNKVQAVAVELDVSANGSVIEGSVKKAWDAFGRIDCLINNAGVRGNVLSSLDLSEEEWNSTVRTNLTGTWLVSKFVSIRMCDVNQGGSIINISSISGVDRQEMPGGVAYSSSKAGVVTLTKVMAMEMGTHNIRVNTICPGLFKSEITEGLIQRKWLTKVAQRTVPLGTYGTIDPALTKLARYLIHDSSKYITGSVFIVDAGTTIPGGRNVVIKQSNGAPKITKDGLTVAKAIEFKDEVKNIGASLVKQVANATNDVAGDGTTCATVLTRAIFSEGCKSLAAGMNAMDLRRGIMMAVDSVVTNLKSRAHMISTSEEITQVGTISANGEREIGELIAKAMERVGKEGVITVQDGQTLYNELEVVEGMKLDRGYISPHFITNTKNQKCELDDPIVLIYEKKLSNVNSVVKVLDLALMQQRPLLIVAEDVESEALATLILNMLRNGIKVCAIKAPGFGENRKANLQDLATLTGGQIITEELGMNLDNVKSEMLGSCLTVTVSKDDTVVVLYGDGDKKSIEERCEQIRSAIESSTSDYDREKFQERLARLSGGVAVLKIGGASDTEVSEKKDRVTDALNATKAAVEEGIVPGGGVALLYASKELDKLQTANFDQKIGVQIIQNALKMPVHTIASNAGVEGSVVVRKLLEQDDPDLGYDAAKGEYVDMVKNGIIDPLKVIRTALVDAASVASLMTTTEAIVTELPKPASEAAPGMGGGMGGMGGMDQPCDSKKDRHRFY